MNKIDYAYEFIYSRIQNGFFQPGLFLKERDVAEALKISRTPVREAFRRLEENGLITFVPYRGVQVSNYSKEQIKQLYEVRICLEVLAAEICANKPNKDLIKNLEVILETAEEVTNSEDIVYLRNTNRDFHNTIINYTENPFLIAKLKDLQTKIDICMMQSLSNVGRPSHTLEEHKLIVWALKTQNKELSKEIVRYHIEKSLTNVLLNYN